MWFFKTPEIVFGEDALFYLEELRGQRAFVITDAQLRRLGLVRQVEEHLRRAGMEVHVFDMVEPNPTVDLVRIGADVIRAFNPDWIVAVGGGSVIDAAKAIWVLFERPDLDPLAISPMEPLGLRRRARLVAIPTTSGTGSEATWAIVLTDPRARRKLGVGSRENMPDIAIVDPAMAMDLPPRLTADTGMDALSHALEGYVSTWRNPFSDAMCLHAARLIFAYLPRAYRDGARDPEARAHMHLAATMAGIGFGNAMVGLAHSLGHALGARFDIPHGRAVGLFLPYVIEFNARVAADRYAHLLQAIGRPSPNGPEAAFQLSRTVLELLETLEQPQTVAACGIPRDDFEADLPTLVEYALEDPSTLTNPRSPTAEEVEHLLLYAYEGKMVDF
ncbi:iron-containing alcohol dehydrogenase [Thermoflexus hugenholtzii]|uniref:Alcohol dehydrogenase, class IV n=1 Tax=Thermoflexus hugenholtzii JAD2 TaxID=877466 RepID=A0A212RKD1_9CHLR|nr:iron-containing alcohol dehydrogenase [Thermoflexus hugenholtzii]SNB72919.1 Alcohol dehydrogenase, class IV [Thermoflexus hugenholtzii JAD2]